MFKRILVPIKAKEKSEGAVHLSYDLAQLHKSEIILFNVISPKEEAGAVTNVGREERRKIMEEDSYKMLYSIKRTAPDERMKVFIDIVDGDPATKISETAQKNEVDLIVLSKSGKIGPRRVLVGDVALKVAEITSIPIMLITE